MTIGALTGEYMGWIIGATKLVSITPHNDTVYDPPLRVLRIKTDGYIKILGAHDPSDASAQEFAVTAGETIAEFVVKKVMVPAGSAATLFGGR